MSDLKKILTYVSLLVFDHLNEYTLKFNKKVETPSSMITINDSKYVADILGNATVEVFNLGY